MSIAARHSLAVCAGLGLLGALRAQQTHWAYRRIEAPAVPAVAEAGWQRPLDAFVRTAMRAHGLEPSPAADRGTWLRRVTLDLTGLPPTVAELDAFLADGADDAAAKASVVDRLLRSPAYAERWTQWWLDLARYADSQGYEKDNLRRTMWRYRDQVLAAFAADQPFDQFTLEQLAGDLLPGASDEQRLATAFHRQTMTNTEGGTDDEEFRVAAVVDRVDTTMSVWTGSTFGCAQCHDHKYDPFTQREFFQLFAFFDQTADADRDDDAPVLVVPTATQRAAQKAIELELTDVRAQLAAAVAATPPPTMSDWHWLGPVRGRDFEHAHGERFAVERDGVRLDAEQDGLRWQRRAGFRDGVVHEWRGDNSAFYLHRTIDAATAGKAELALGSDDALVVWWNGVEVLRKLVGRPAAPGQERLELAVQAGTNTVLLKVTNGGGPGGFCFELTTDPRVAALQRKVRELETAFAAERGPAVPVLRELPEGKRRTTRVHRRGSFLDQGDVVTPDVPKVLPPLPTDAPRNRLGLARWLVSRDNPLTARVLVNRIWSELFGAGIVPTLEDFGTQGDPPSHPELLDWLAVHFVERGWSLRELLRTIVLSTTYGQSSVQTERQRELDPYNRWLARGPSVRLSAEMLRDQVLAVSGRLAPRFGGPSVMPAQPDGIWLQMYSGEKWVAADGDDAYRRSLYTFWRRTSPHPAMLLFDAQSREACVLRRRPTNTPLQALVAWNEPTFVAAAQALAKLVALGVDPMRVGDDVLAGRLWRQCLLREPAADEWAMLLKLLADEQWLLREDPATAKRLLAGSGVEDLALAPWVVVAGVVLSLDEFVTKR
ncbi:MAG: DUF1553 domain-containing protein [Planctomycetes bacterium]|nr:DUF1553 domain-containing protein [Planctomycetota bacterium]